jgi:thiamine monophosphate synthase
LDAAKRAKNAGADLVVFGAVFDSSEKKGKGVPDLAEICRELKEFPVLAVGGIDDEKIQIILASGAAGYASIRYLNEKVHATKRQ